MKVYGMEDFQDKCRMELVHWYNTDRYTPRNIAYNETFIVWSCKTLQNYKCLCSTSVPDDSIYVEFTYNGDKEELYMDVYFKNVNEVIK